MLNKMCVFLAFFPFEYNTEYTYIHWYRTIQYYTLIAVRKQKLRFFFTLLILMRFLHLLCRILILLLLLPIIYRTFVFVSKIHFVPTCTRTRLYDRRGKRIRRWKNDDEENKSKKKKKEKQCTEVNNKK